MPELPVIVSERLARQDGVRHAFFTRQGGVSGGVYGSLNVGLGSRDDPAAVAENRRRVAGHFEAGPDALMSAYQIHSATALSVDGPWVTRPEGDAVATRTPGLVCGALAADCAPVLLADGQARVVAAAHAGWKGALGGVVESTVAVMEALGARAGRITAVVGPCIGPDSYEVGLDFLDRFTREDPASGRFFRAGADAERRWFDLPAYVLDRLGRAGVGGAEWTGHDTCADEERFFSNRRAFRRGEADYGRLISCITLV